MKRFPLVVIMMLAGAGAIAVAGCHESAKKGSAAQEPPDAGGTASPEKRGPRQALAPDDEVGICAAICARCEKMRALPVCREAMRAALRCFALVPTPGWTCDGDGSPAVEQSRCTQEQ